MYRMRETVVQGCDHYVRAGGGVRGRAVEAQPAILDGHQHDVGRPPAFSECQPAGGIELLHHQGGATDSEHRSQEKQRGVRTKGCRYDGPRLRIDAEPRAHRLRLERPIAAALQDPFRYTGGSRGVDQVESQLWRDICLRRCVRLAGHESCEERIIQLALALLGGIVTWFAITLVQRNADLDATSLPWSMAWMYVPLIPAGVLMAVQGLAQAIAAGGKADP